MKGLKLFWHFIKEASLEILANKKNYGYSFFALIILGNLESLNTLMGVSDESSWSILATVVSTLMVFMVISNIVLIQKRKHGGPDDLIFFVPTFLLYNLYYSFLFFLGLLCFLTPGIYVLIFFSMVPFVAVLDNEGSGNVFKKSHELVKKNISLVAWASLINLLMECSPLLFAPIGNEGLKTTLLFLFSLPDAFATMVMTVATVKIYYYLRNK